ncbi:MAG: hypothetical protein EOO77_19750 [Oxalobacteraceae bacterium]|nr:MAG: hypothetical protein EOO77_19750 [Oxalobacteraceae bacterium]
MSNPSIISTDNLNITEDDRVIATLLVGAVRDERAYFDEATDFVYAAKAFYDQFGVYPSLEEFGLGYSQIAAYARDTLDYQPDCPEHDKAVAELVALQDGYIRTSNDDAWPNARTWIEQNLTDKSYTERLGDDLQASFTFDDPTSQTLWLLWSK